MPIYEYRCPTCGSVTETLTRDSFGPYCCGETPMKRVYSFQAAPVWQSHFDSTTGTVISDQRQWERDLKQKSEEQTERTGIPHNYVPADRSDVKTLGVTEEGLKETHDRKVSNGEIAPTPKLVL